jgi:DNA-binding transcriptional ArsR family regulator
MYSALCLRKPASASSKELSAEHEKCVCDLVDCCGLGWSTVSHHLSILREAGIVQDEKRGQQIFYRLVQPCVTHFIRCLEQPTCEPEMHSAVCCR